MCCDRASHRCSRDDRRRASGSSAERSSDPASDADAGVRRPEKNAASRRVTTGTAAGRRARPLVVAARRSHIAMPQMSASGRLRANPYAARPSGAAALGSPRPGPARHGSDHARARGSRSSVTVVIPDAGGERVVSLAPTLAPMAARSGRRSSQPRPERASSRREADRLARREDAARRRIRIRRTARTDPKPTQRPQTAGPHSLWRALRWVRPPRDPPVAQEASGRTSPRIGRRTVQVPAEPALGRLRRDRQPSGREDRRAARRGP